MTTLAIESSGRSISAALRNEEGIWEVRVDAGFRHAETLMPAIAGLFDLAGCEPSSADLVSCSAGPGSFTALRIGMAAAKGIARGADCALKAVPTLPLLAAGREHWPGIVAPVMDARKKRVYAAAFRGGERIFEDSDMDLNMFLSALPEGVPVLTTGPDAHITEGLDGITVDPLCNTSRAAFMIDMAEAAFEKDGPDPADLGPIYIRLSEAEENLAKGL